MDKRSRNWCFTLNNYTENDVTFLKDELKCEYLIIGFEVGEQGTAHLQGYIEFKNGLSLTALKTKLINQGYHLECRLGTAKQAIDYCKKDGNFYEKGEASRQGHRTDLDEVVLAINSKSFVPSDFPITFIKYHKGIAAYGATLQCDRTSKPYIEWRWGGTGVGKTRGAIEKHGLCNTYIKDGTMWWDGFDPARHQCIVIDDFDGKWPFRDLLRLLDHYPYQGQFKGGFVKINSPFITITAEFSPDHWYGGTELKQLLRRIDIVSNII